MWGLSLNLRYFLFLPMSRLEKGEIFMSLKGLKVKVVEELKFTSSDNKDFVIPEGTEFEILVEEHGNRIQVKHENSELLISEQTVQFKRFEKLMSKIKS